MGKQNLRSEAAIKRWLKLPLSVQYVVQPDRETPHIIPLIEHFFNSFGGVSSKTIAEIDLHDLIKKRKPSTGIKKQMSEIVSGKKKVKK